VCKNVLNFLRTNIFNKKVAPTFVLVEDSNERIQEVMSYGATDYIIPLEGTEAILQKIKVVLSERGNFSGTSAIDITPEKATPSSTGIRVYVIEDDPLLRNLLSISFEKAGLPAEFNQDGQQVVTLMRQFKPQAVILDLMLPGRSGFEILQEIRNEEDFKDVAVIIFSNRDSQEDRAKAIEFGATAFYVKAMTDLSELVKKIEAAVK
jgi:CheY-like chemotaxis protein